MFKIMIKSDTPTLYLRHVDLADGGAYIHWSENIDSAQDFESYEQAKAFIEDYGLDEEGAIIQII